MVIVYFEELAYNVVTTFSKHLLQSISNSVIKKWLIYNINHHLLSLLWPLITTYGKACSPHDVEYLSYFLFLQSQPDGRDGNHFNKAIFLSSVTKSNQSKHDYYN